MKTITQEILEALKAREGFVSGQALSDRLGVSRVTVSKHIRRLREQGYRIVSLPRRGHCLEQCTDLPVVAEVAPLLKGQHLGRPFQWLESVDSTNSYLARLPSEERTDGMVVVAERQTGGRGRMGRQWHSPPGCGLYFSVLLRPTASPAELAQLALVVGVAVCSAMTRLYPTLRIGIKWPNDILIDQRKVAGILCEMEAEADAVHQVILGVGVNVNTSATALPPDLRTLATSLSQELGQEVDRVALLVGMLNQLDKDYAVWCRRGLAPLLPRLQERSVLTGLSVTVESPRGRVRGVAETCDAEGCLRIRMKNGSVRSVPSGEVHVHWRGRDAHGRRKGQKIS